MNRGQAALVADGRSLGQIAKLLAEHGCPVTRQGVRGWRIGQSTPGRTNRLGLKAAVGIAPEAWDLKADADDCDRIGPADAGMPELGDLHNQGPDELEALAQAARRERQRADLSEPVRARWAGVELRALSEIEARKSAVARWIAVGADREVVERINAELDPVHAGDLLAWLLRQAGDHAEADRVATQVASFRAEHPEVVERFEAARQELEQAFKGAARIA